MDAWVWWVIAAAVLAAAEVMTLDLVFAMAAAGALAGAGVAAGTGNTPLQVTAAILISVAGLVLLRPVALRHVRTKPDLRTGISALIGRKAEVLEAVGPRGGRVKLAGEVWSARSYDGESTYAVGTDVAVFEIDGATALVG